MASKIESELTPIEVVEMLHKLASTPGGAVLRVIQEEARKRGIDVSPMGAKSFRDGALHPYLVKLREARQKSNMLAEAVSAGDETGLLASGRTMLADKINDLLMSDEVTDKQIGGLSKALGILSSASQQGRVTEARIKEYEAREEERREGKAKLDARKNSLAKKGGLSEEAISLMEDALNLLG